MKLNDNLTRKYDTTTTFLFIVAVKSLKSHSVQFMCRVRQQLPYFKLTGDKEKKVIPWWIISHQDQFRVKSLLISD